MINQSMYEKAKRDARKNDNLCIICGKPLSTTLVNKGNTRCRACLRKLREYISARNKKLDAKGICRQCAKMPAMPGNTKCSECQKRSEYFRNHLDKRKVLWNSAKLRAERKNIEFSIRFDDIHIPDICPLLEKPFSKKGYSDYSMSLDRIDSTKGYVPENIWVISHKANRIKSNATLDELEKVYKNLKHFLMAA